MAFIGVRLSDRLAAQFEAVAASRGGKSQLLRALMESAVQAPAEVIKTTAAGRGRSEKVTLRLRSEELAALDAASASVGMRRTEWLANLARRRLLNAPQFDRAQAEALLDARRDLRRISIALTEAVAVAREGEGAVEVDIDALRLEVRQHLERLREAIAGNLAYWDEVA